MILANIFQPLIEIFGPLLVFFHGIIGGSWGWSIIALTVVVRALLLPLAFRQMHSMQKLQQVAPQMKAIQAKYKDGKQRQQQEITKFYKDNGINPFASFLPLVAQIPVFIGLFYTLRTRLREDICPGLQAAYRHGYALHHNIPLKEAVGHTTACHGLHGSSWLFIHDLTNTATGLTLVLLIVLYVATQLASSLMMRAPTMDQTQRRMMLLLPLFFVIFIISFPAGLILYWTTTNTWTMAQQWAIRRRIGPVVAGDPGSSRPIVWRPRRPARRHDRQWGRASGGGGGLSGSTARKAQVRGEAARRRGVEHAHPARGAAHTSTTHEDEAFTAPALVPKPRPRGDPLICRTWHGWTTTENAPLYEEIVRGEVIPAIEARRIPGFLSIDLVRRPVPEGFEFATIMWFSDIDSVKAFVGEDYEVAHVPEHAQEVLSHFDTRSTHFEVLDRREQRKST